MGSGGAWTGKEEKRQGGFWKPFLPGRKKSMQLKPWTVLSAAHGDSAWGPASLVEKKMMGQRKRWMGEKGGLLS